MNYWWLNVIFLGLALLVALLAWVRSGALRPVGSPALWRAASLGSALLLITAVFDNLMISVGLVGYDRHKISGLFIGIAPLEDFAYAVAAAVLLPSLWVLFAPREAS